MANNRGEMFCSVFEFVRVLDCSGFSGLTCLTFMLKNVDGKKVWCSVCSVDFVENLWESWWVSMWVSGGKNCGKVDIRRVLHRNVQKFTRFVGNWGKVLRRIYTC